MSDIDDAEAVLPYWKMMERIGPAGCPSDRLVPLCYVRSSTCPHATPSVLYPGGSLAPCDPDTDSAVPWDAVFDSVFDEPDYTQPLDIEPLFSKPSAGPRASASGGHSDEDEDEDHESEPWDSLWGEGEGAGEGGDWGDSLWSDDHDEGGEEGAAWYDSDDVTLTVHKRNDDEADAGDDDIAYTWVHQKPTSYSVGTTSRVTRGSSTRVYSKAESRSHSPCRCVIAQTGCSHCLSRVCTCMCVDCVCLVIQCHTDADQRPSAKC